MGTAKAIPTKPYPQSRTNKTTPKNRTHAIPFTLVINRQGQIVYRHPGEISRAKLLEVLVDLNLPSM